MLQAAQHDIFVTYRPSLDTHRPNHLQVGHTHHDFLHAVHLQGPHATLHRHGEQLGNPGTFLNKLFDVVVRHQQFVQTNTAFVAGLVALVAANGFVKLDLAVSHQLWQGNGAP